MESSKNGNEASTSGFEEKENEDTIVTMVDVLEQEAEQESDANAVLGGADDKNCTYLQGYVPRQPLYTCKTCCKDKLAAVCLACSYNCHEGHDLIELYTKRNFRCDCGNSLFSGAKCTLDAVKDEINEKNHYNQNFKGVYCTCQRPYPDPEDEQDDVMTQCVVCEDWFHGRHLETKEESSDEEGELVCHLCMERLPFLVKSGTANAESVALGACKIADRPAETPAGKAQATVFPAGWRKTLCRCQSCLDLFNKHQVSYLLDEGDSVLVYESLNKQRSCETQYERGMRALSGLDRVQQVEAIQSYNEMKSALMEHLQKFADDQKVVSESDIREFFDEMKAKRRRVVAPPTCR